MKKSYLLKYLNRNKRLIPCKNKKPLIKNWPSSYLSYSELQKHEVEEYAWVLGAEDLVIDVDARNNGHASFKRLEKTFNLSLNISVKTPGGFHVYLKKSTEKIRKNLPEYPGIDFLSEGNCCHIAGSVVNSKEYQFFLSSENAFDETTDCSSLLSVLKIPHYSDKKKYDDVFYGMGNEASEESVDELLNYLDPDMKNEDWVKVGMALKRWDKEKGLVLWEKWSRGGKTYEVGETARRWKSFDDKNQITLGTLHYLAKKTEIKDKLNMLEGDLKRIEAFSIEDIAIHTSDIIKRHQSDLEASERVLKVIQARTKELTGVRPSLPSLKQKHLKPQKLSNQDSYSEVFENWYYVNSHRQYCNIETLNFYNTEGFNLLCTQLCPINKNGNRQTASKYVTQFGLIKFVDTIAYLPFEKEKVVNIGGKEMINTFDCKTLPKVSSGYSKNGMSYIDDIKRHAVMICNNEKNADILLNYIAHNVQYPGKKILWSPIIQSFQGAGKTFFGDLISTLLGEHNVGVVSPNQIVSDFNGWAEGKCVNILQELRIQGHNRYEAVNAVKPLITDKYIQINVKHIQAYTTINTTNYICFTNFKDAVPVLKDDRRWWVIYCNLDSLDEVKEHVGVDKIQDYYNPLFANLKTYQGELVKYFHEYVISDEFLSYKQAPHTDYKELAISTSEDDIEYKADIKNLLEAGGKYFNTECFSTRHLLEAARCSIVGFNRPGPRILSTIFKSLGYSKHPRHVAINKQLCYVWLKRPMLLEEIKRSLKIY